MESFLKVLTCFAYLLCLCWILSPCVIHIRKTQLFLLRTLWRSIKFSFLPTAHPCKKAALRALLLLAGQIILLPNSYRSVTLSCSCCERQMQCCHPAVQTEAPITHPGLPTQCSGLIWKCWWCCFITWRLRGCAESSSACTAAATSRAQQECSVTVVLLCLCITVHCNFIGTRGRSAAPEQSTLVTFHIGRRLSSTCAPVTHLNSESKGPETALQRCLLYRLISISSDTCCKALQLQRKWSVVFLYQEVANAAAVWHTGKISSFLLWHGHCEGENALQMLLTAMSAFRHAVNFSVNTS